MAGLLQGFILFSVDSCEEKVLEVLVSTETPIASEIGHSRLISIGDLTVGIFLRR